MMKVIDRSEVNSQASKSAGILGSVRNRLGHSWSQKEAQAQEVVIGFLQKALDNKYYMLRDITLEGPDVPIPLILVGPPGIRVVYASTAKGVFRAKEDNWEVLDDRTQRFTIARPNLLSRTLLMAKAVTAYLTTRGYQIPEVEPVLFFSDPGIHVDAARPIARIVLADALDRYVAGLVQSRIFLDQDTIQKIVNILAGDNMGTAEARLILDERDAFSFRDLPPETLSRSTTATIIDRSEPTILKKIPFSSRQWVVLGLMVLVNIIIIVAFVLLILLSS